LDVRVGILWGVSPDFSLPAPLRAGSTPRAMRKETLNEKGSYLARIGGSCMVAGEMKTRVVKLDSENVDSAEIKEAAEVIDAGGLVAFPTETVYE